MRAISFVQHGWTSLILSLADFKSQEASILGKKFRIEFCLPIMRLLELICRRTTEDDDHAVKVEIVDTAGEWW